MSASKSSIWSNESSSRGVSNSVPLRFFIVDLRNGGGQVNGFHLESVRTANSVYDDRQFKGGRQADDGEQVDDKQFDHDRRVDVS